MKHYLMAAVALICMTITCVAFTACSNNTDERESIISYSATGTVNAVDDMSALFAVASYNSAIKNVVPDYGTTEKDAEVIAACDKVYADHTANHPNYRGTVTITKFKGIDDKTGTTLKTYEYK